MPDERFGGIISVGIIPIKSISYPQDSRPYGEEEMGKFVCLVVVAAMTCVFFVMVFGGSDSSYTLPTSVPTVAVKAASTDNPAMTEARTEALAFCQDVMESLNWTENQRASCFKVMGNYVSSGGMWPGISINPDAPSTSYRTIASMVDLSTIGDKELNLIAEKMRAHGEQLHNTLVKKNLDQP